LVQRRDLGILSNIVGRVLVLAALVMLAPLIVCVIFGEFFAIPGFLAGAGLSLLLGLLLYFPFRKFSDARTKHGMMGAAICWLIVPMFGAIPFAMVAQSVPSSSGLLCNMTALDSYFEAMSGWTATGLSVATSQELLPRSIQFWRSWREGVGGVGIIVMMLVILARPGTGAFELYAGEGRTEKLEPRIIGTVRQMWRIYVLYTIAGIILLFALGMPLWDSINHAMAALATGGFSVKDQSIGSYGNPAFEVAIIGLMLIGAISFVVHDRVFRGRIRELLDDVQNKVLFSLCILGIALLTLELFYEGPFQGTLEGALRSSSFQFVSGLATGGYQTADLRNWTPSAKILLSMAMIAGGAAGSTCGGIKLVRLIMIMKGAGWKFMETFMPSGAYVPKKLGKVVLSEDETTRVVLEAATLSFMYLILLLVGVMVLMHTVGPAVPASDVFFEVCSAQGNTGLSVGIARSGMNQVAESMLIVNMWVGRLEILPVLMLLQSFFFYARPRRRAREV